ncbi:hypothetical protein EV368DRAFT_42349 [Lentinula lateritia]|nr:hypothetical protein EV368DRAFT_42349 [Lentinula lateritia]
MQEPDESEIVERETIDLYDIALLLNYERASSEPRFRNSKLREVATHEFDFRSVMIKTPLWTAHKGAKDGFVFQRIKRAIHDSDESEPDLPSNILSPQVMSPLARDITQLAPSRLETIYWQARGHDGCFKSVAILQYFLDLYAIDPLLRIRLANGREYVTSSSPTSISIVEYDLLVVKHLTLAVVLPDNQTYITGSSDQPRFRHAVVSFDSHPYNGDNEIILDMASMQFGETGRGPGRKGKCMFVLESLGDYKKRLLTVAGGFEKAKVSSRITPDPNQANEAWMWKVAKKAKERWEKRGEHHWCGHCGRPLANGPGLKRCSRCRQVYYCDEEHQKMAWSSHHKSWCRQA